MSISSADLGGKATNNFRFDARVQQRFHPKTVSVMLSNLVKEHNQRAATRRDLQEKRRQEACQAASQLTDALVDHLNVGVAQAYLNQKKLDAEAKELHTHAAEFARQTQQWLNLIDNFNGSLKELGDVETWSKAIEKDLRAISSSLEYTYKVNREGTEGTN